MTPCVVSSEGEVSSYFQETLHRKDTNRDKDRLVLGNHRVLLALFLQGQVHKIPTAVCTSRMKNISEGFVAVV